MLKIHTFTVVAGAEGETQHWCHSRHSNRDEQVALADAIRSCDEIAGTEWGRIPAELFRAWVIRGHWGTGQVVHGIPQTEPVEV